MMKDFDSLGEMWRAQGPESGGSREEIETVRQRARGMARTVRRRDWLETGVALVLLPIFGWIAFTTPQPLSAIGAAIVAASCVLIPLRLRLARRAPPDAALPVAQALRAELTAIRAQERLLRSVGWWYAGPLGIGVILFVAGSPVSTTFKIAYGAIVVLLFAGLIRMNRMAARRQLEPLADDIENWLAGMDEPPAEGANNAH